MKNGFCGMQRTTILQGQFSKYRKDENMLIRYAFSIQGVEKEGVLNQLKEIISEERRKKMERYRFEADKIRSLFAEVLVRYGLKKHFGMEKEEVSIEKNEYGKPELIKRKDIHYNVSHSGDWVICAFSSFPVGVDVEIEKEHNLDIAKRFFDKTEYETLRECESPKELFISYWTLKESYVKAEGKGMQIPFDTFSFDIAHDEIKLQVEGKPCNTYEFQVYGIADGVQVATCSREPIEGKFKIVSLQDLVETLL